MSLEVVSLAPLQPCYCLCDTAVVDKTGDGDGDAPYSLRCVRCGAHTKPCPTKVDAIKAWNCWDRISKRGVGYQ